MDQTGFAKSIERTEPMNNLGSPLQIFIRNTSSMVLREMRSKFGEQKLSYVWALVEPLGWILMMSTIFLAMGSHVPPVGDSFVMFFSTGLVPFSAFKDTGNVVRNAVKQNKPLLFFPIIKPIDAFVSRAVLETLTQITVFAIIVGTHSFVYGSIPRADWINVIIPFALLAIMGFNVGILNCVITAHFHAWEQIWGIISRPLFILSGIFFVADTLPPEARYVLSWNPMMHCIEWLRSGFFPEFHSTVVDVGYVLSFTFGGLFLALVLERVFRNKILE
ncbi:capsular polysaccharide transport system permease protein [Breoghania corrubedonensis]|uniref:Transport permease protein n=1 Tax=Breoghania corrubedonensis TaxID=665038 RepID=A0A2T5VB93_9HYPH|nr:ABC transporter permease [Breoghania corrubedonensis]PTW61018.1 capsular polysaccharide transport system permease protein [Breoghania corrubedonensis]